MMVGWSDVVTTTVQIVIKSLLDVVLNLLFAVTSTSQEDSGCGGLCTFNSFWMIVGCFGGCLGNGQDAV